VVLNYAAYVTSLTCTSTYQKRPSVDRMEREVYGINCCIAGELPGRASSIPEDRLSYPATLSITLPPSYP
jgi:hypothetical protein